MDADMIAKASSLEVEGKTNALLLLLVAIDDTITSLMGRRVMSLSCFA